MEIFGIRLFPDEAEDASPIDPKRGYRLALILLLLGAAILAAPRCIEPLKDPYHRFRSRLYTRSAEAFLAKGDAASARIQLANAIRHDGDNSRPWLALAGTLDAEGSPESARALVRAWACEPHRTDFAIAALRACLAKDNRELANALGDTILKRHPDNPEIWYLHGAIWIRSGNLRPGYAALRRARELAPQDARFLITIASLEGLADGLIEEAGHGLGLEGGAELALEHGGGNLALAEAVYADVLAIVLEELVVGGLHGLLADGYAEAGRGILEPLDLLVRYHVRSLSGRRPARARSAAGYEYVIVGAPPTALTGREAP